MIEKPKLTLEELKRMPKGKLERLLASEQQRRVMVLVLHKKKSKVDADRLVFSQCYKADTPDKIVAFLNGEDITENFPEKCGDSTETER